MYSSAKLLVFWLPLCLVFSTSGSSKVLKQVGVSHLRGVVVSHPDETDVPDTHWKWPDILL
jgi:hypothetical protein